MKSAATKKVKSAKKTAKTAAAGSKEPVKRSLKASAAKSAKPAKGTIKSADTGKARPAKKPTATKKQTGRARDPRVRRILSDLNKRYPSAQCALKHDNAFQLLVATILSAQCTDARVNKVTPGLFEKYPGPLDFASLDQRVLEQDIRSTGFFRNKAKNIIGAAQKIVKDFKGEVPQSMDEMLTLPGVARKTANVVLGTAYKKRTGVVVDTHVFRIAHRLKLSNGKTPENVENDLKELIPESRWILFGHQVILFGRDLCQARKPRCMECPLEPICDSPDKTV